MYSTAWSIGVTSAGAIFRPWPRIAAEKVLQARRTGLLNLIEFMLPAILPESSNPAQIDMNCRNRQTAAAPVVDDGTFTIIAGSRSHGSFDAVLMNWLAMLSGNKCYRNVKTQDVGEALWITATSR
jgi:hypothetical protein